MWLNNIILNYFKIKSSSHLFYFKYLYIIIMTSAYLAISFLKETSLPEKQLRIFLSYLPQEPLKDYLSNANIYKKRRNMSKHDLIGMIISEKSKKIIYTQENDDLTKEEANELLKNNNFAKQTENNIPNIPPEVKRTPKPLNN